MYSEAEEKTILLAKKFAEEPFPFPNSSLLQLIAKLDREANEITGMRDDASEDRNHALLLVFKMARELSTCAAASATTGSTRRRRSFTSTCRPDKSLSRCRRRCSRR